MRTLATVAACLTLAALTGTGCFAGGSNASRATALRASPAPEPMYAAGAGSSSGSASFGNFVRAREPQLQFCYQETRAASPALAGTATVTVALAPDGRVLSADIVRRSWSGADKPEAGPEVVERCVLSRVRGWKFPAAEEDDAREKHVHSFAVIFSR